MTLAGPHDSLAAGFSPAVSHVQFSLDSDTGVLRGARQVPSPNFDERPAGCAIEVLIIHAISLPPGEFGGDYIERFFLSELPRGAHPFFAEIHEVKVSAHFLIYRTGEIVQFVPVNKRAWHAGVSSCLGREAVNDFSIGIELEGCDDRPFEDAQYDALENLSRALIDGVPTLSSTRIYGHCDIAPERKTDPGPLFDWQRYRQALAGDGAPRDA